MSTTTGDILETMILPALRRGGYSWQRHVFIGQRPGGGKHYVDAIVSKDAKLLLVSSKWQQVSGTAEQKVPFEVICLIQALHDRPEYLKAYIVLGGPAWTLRKFYTSGGLRPFLSNSANIFIVSLERFVALANNGEL